MQSEVTAEGFHVIAYTVSKPIRYAEVHKGVAKALQSFIRDELSRLPDKIVDRVLKLVVAGICPASGNSIGQDLIKSKAGTADADGTVIFDFANPMTTSDKLQDFTERVYDDLVIYHRADSSNGFSDGSGGLRRKVSRSAPWSKGAAVDEDEFEKKKRKERTQREREESAEKEASEGTERVEGVLCRLLYNRLVSCR